jgi:hypothetical protein
MQFKNILQNRLYAFPTSQNLFDEDSLDLLKNIFKNANLGEPIKECIELIDSNYNYDIYRVDFKDQSVCVKVSFDAEETYLKREFDLFKSKDSSLYPKAIAFNSITYGIKLNYSIISYENYLSINKIGDSVLLSSSDFLFSKLNEMNFLPRSKNNINFVIDSLFRYCDLDNIIPQHTIESIKIKYNINLLKNFISTLKLEINNLCKNECVSKNDFCHGNLKPSNILSFEDEFKFINFENYFTGNKYFDLASLSINFKLNPDLNKSFFKKYLTFNEIKFCPNEWESYRICYNIILRKKLLELLISYFFENFVLSQHRLSKIFEIISLYVYNVENFQHIQCFKNNYNLISDIFTEAIIGTENE